MSSAQTIPCPDSDSVCDHQLVATAEAYTRAHPRGAREARHLAMLREMQDDNMCIQSLLRAEAQAEARRRAQAEHRQDEEAGPSRLEAIGRAHATLVRATRLLMMTEIQIEDGQIARLEGNVSLLKAQAEEEASYQSLHELSVDEQTDAVRQVVEEMIERQVEDDLDRADTLLKGLYGALETLSQEDGFAEAPVGELAARITADLGFAPDWDDWEDEEWAKDEAHLEMEGSPFCPQPRVVRDADGRYRFSSQKVAANGTGPP